MYLASMEHSWTNELQAHMTLEAVEYMECNVLGGSGTSMHGLANPIVMKQENASGSMLALIASKEEKE